MSKLLEARSPALERALVDALMSDIKTGSGQGEESISSKSGKYKQIKSAEIWVIGWMWIIHTVLWKVTEALLSKENSMLGQQNLGNLIEYLDYIAANYE